MKILKPGKLSKKWSIRHSCTAWGNSGVGCDALLELEFEDLRYFPGVPGDSWGSRDPAVSFKCPCCGKLTDLGMQDWPTGYRDLERWSKEWQDEKPDWKEAS